MMSAADNRLSTPTHAADRGASRAALCVPPLLRDALGKGRTLATPEEYRRFLTDQGLCDPRYPAVILELYGGLRLASGCDRLPLHAGSVGQAVDVLERISPEVRRLLPTREALATHYRFCINGLTVVANPAHPLKDNDHLILFSASVGG